MHAAFFIGTEQPTPWERDNAIEEYYSHLISDVMTSSASQFNELTADPDIQGSTDNGMLTIPNIRAAIKQIMNAVDEEYLNGVKTVYIVHPPDQEVQATRTISTLPAAGTAGQTKLVSVENPEGTKVFPLETYSMDFHHKPFESTGWITIMFNPEKPVVEVLVPTNMPASIYAPLYGFEDTTGVERSVMKAIRKRLSVKGIEVDQCSHEPNGEATFPDFEVKIGNQLWTIEITRVLEGIADGRVIRMGSYAQSRMTIAASQASSIGEGQVNDAVAYAVSAKSGKAAECKPDSKYCLVLVNPAILNIGHEQYDWSRHDLSSFDAVVLVQIRPGPTAESTNIKGNLIPEDV